MKKQKMHALLSTLTILIGAVLMAYMISVESEPGALPVLLIGSGIGWYLVTRFRFRSHQTEPPG